MIFWFRPFERLRRASRPRRSRSGCPVKGDRGAADRDLSCMTLRKKLRLANEGALLEYVARSRTSSVSWLDRAW